MRANKVIWIGVILLVGVGVMVGPVLAQSDRPKTQATMRGLYDALTKCYVASLNPATFESDKNREEILLGLRALSANAKQLEKHDELGDSFDYLRRSLARDAKDAAKRFEERNYLASKYVLSNLTESCVSCHSKLPSDVAFDMGDAFVQDVKIQEMPLRDRARIEMAVRQFDKAMGTYEELIENAVTPEQIMMEGVFDEYIKLCLRVQLDAARPTKTIQSFQQRNLGGPIEDRMNAWLKALGTVDLKVASGQELSASRAMIESGKEANAYPQDRNGLVYFLAASSLLNRFLDAAPADPNQASEAFYLLGVAESYTATSYWISETEFYLTQAVDVAPESEHAQASYDFLYEYVTAKYSGSAGVQIPLDVQDELDAVKSKLK